MTPRQLEILDCYRDYISTHGVGPTLQEVADTLNIGKVAVYCHVESLLRQGALHRGRPGTARNIVPADICPCCGGPFPRSIVIEDEGVVECWRVKD